MLKSEHNLSLLRHLSRKKKQSDMKRIFFIATLLVAALSLNAQDCETFMLPFFQGDAARLAEYPAEKLEWRCRYAHNAFYESDVVPEGAQIVSITEVTDKTTGEKLSADFQVDLSTLCYYGYDFQMVQIRYRKCDVTICFPTPASKHPYLVMRSLDETYDRTEHPERYEK